MTTNTTGCGHAGKGTIHLCARRDKAMMDLLMIGIVLGFFWCLFEFVDFLSRL